MPTDKFPDITLANTFYQWLNVTNGIGNTANDLYNNNFVKEAGSFSTNGDIIINSTGTLEVFATGLAANIRGDVEINKTLLLHTTPSVTVNALSAILSASNTATVSVNGTGTKIAKLINFVDGGGVTVTATNGSGGNVDISFTSSGSQGVQGAQGAQGATGLTGSQGATGAQGAAGGVGSQGYQGRQGAGVQGATGPQGPQGPAGSGGSGGGAQGATGATGPQGPAGSPGAQGASGSTSVAAPILRHVSSGYTGGGQVFVDPSPPTASATGDVWFDTSTMGSLAANGWTKLPNGLYIMWGSTSSSGVVSITFPTTFPTTCVSVTCSSIRGGTGSVGTNHVHSVTASGCVIILDGASGGYGPGGYWMAFGY